MQRLSLLALRWPLIASGLALAVLVAAVIGIGRIGFDDGMRTAFAGPGAVYRHYELNRHRFTQSDGDIAVLFHAADFADARRLAAVRGFALEAGLAAHVEETYSIFALRTPPGADGASRPLLPADLAAAGDLRPVLDRLRRHPLGGRRLLSRDHGLTMVLVTQRSDRSDLEPSRDTLQELDRLAAAAVAGTDVSYAITGLAPLRQIVIDGLLRDMVKLNGIGILIGFAICMVALRSPLLALLTGLPPAVALVWVLGAMGWLGLPINTVTNAVPVLIIVLAFADSLHLTFEVRRRRSLRAAPGAIADAAIRVGPACALTSFTTAVAFLALLISDSELIRSFAWSGGLATLVSLVAVLWVHPLTLLFAARWGRVDALLQRRSASLSPLVRGRVLYEFGLRWYRPVAVVALLGLGSALALYATIRPVYSFLENVHGSNPALQSLRRLEAELAPTGSLDIPVALAPGQPLHGAALRDIGRVHAVVAETVPDGEVLSLHTLASWAGSADRLEALLQQMSPTQHNRFLAADRSAALVRVYLADRGAQHTKRLVHRLSAALAEAGLAPGRIGAPTGLLAMSALNSTRMIGHLNVSFVAAVAASGVFIALWFGSWRYGLVALIPNILPIACVGAFLAVAGWGLQFSSAIALTIAFGIAIDDTVHLINRLQLNAPPGDPFNRQAVRRSFGELAPVLVITTAVLSFGMLGTQFSSVPTIAYFGGLCITVFLLALVAVLVILPACLYALDDLLGRRTSEPLE